MTDNPDGDSIIERSVNRHYRTMVKGRPYPQLMVTGEEFDTTDGESSYVTPYPIYAISDNSVLYDVDAGGNGISIELLKDVKILDRTISNYSTDTTRPYACMLNGRLGTTYYSTGSVSVTNKSTTLTGVGTTFTSAMVGKWIVIGYSSTTGASGAGYAYKISEFTNTTTMTLAEPYRGTTLDQAAYEIEPAGSLMLQFAPTFTEYGKTVRYSWYRQPRRLFNPEDILEVDNLADSLIAAVCADLDYYSRNGEGMDKMQQQQRIFAGKTLTGTPIAPR